MRRPFAIVRCWRATDRHTGIGKSGSAPSTYEHIATPPTPVAEAYRVESYIHFVRPTPIHRNVYFVPAAGLNAFLHPSVANAEVVVDVRPVTITEALTELREFRQRHEEQLGQPARAQKRAQGKQS